MAIPQYKKEEIKFDGLGHKGLRNFQFTTYISPFAHLKKVFLIFKLQVNRRIEVQCVKDIILQI